jgi:hypothetical protein
VFSADASGFWEFVRSQLVSLPQCAYSLNVHISSIVDSLRVPVIQPQVRSLTRTLACQVIKIDLCVERIFPQVRIQPTSDLEFLVLADITLEQIKEWDLDDSLSHFLKEQA